MSNSQIIAIAYLLGSGYVAYWATMSAMIGPQQISYYVVPASEFYENGNSGLYRGAQVIAMIAAITPFVGVICALAAAYVAGRLHFSKKALLGL